MFTDSDKMSDAPGTGNTYGLKLLFALQSSIWALSKTGHVSEDSPCVRAIHDRSINFFQLLWEKRYLSDIHLFDEARTFTDRNMFSIMVIPCVLGLLEIFSQYGLDTNMLLTSAAHTLIYQLADPAAHFAKPLLWLGDRLRKESLTGEWTITKAYFEHFSDADDHPRRLFRRLTNLLRDEGIHGRLLVAFDLAIVCQELIRRGPRSIATIYFPAGEGLVPSHLIWFHRQICTTQIALIEAEDIDLTLARIVLKTLT
ncbi:hypothetical protein EIP91_003745 [Steccherinum ochraceum]|uniref:Uncharacterized protein n=1 Tax=Steccherinum ochraceum TaxID=92696 RepID=A0A4R0RNY9_9APHY|nr:hypothetical protein EIP91_003745 [Steccherinum ochraceum]